MLCPLLMVARNFAGRLSALFVDPEEPARAELWLDRSSVSTTEGSAGAESKVSYVRADTTSENAQA